MLYFHSCVGFAIGVGESLALQLVVSGKFVAVHIVLLKLMIVMRACWPGLCLKGVAQDSIFW